MKSAVNIDCIKLDLKVRVLPARISPVEPVEATDEIVGLLPGEHSIADKPRRSAQVVENAQPGGVTLHTAARL